MDGLEPELPLSVLAWHSKATAKRGVRSDSPFYFRAA
jgi:hypothetical protein